MPVPDISRPARVDAKAVVSFPSVTTNITLLTCPANTIYRLRSCFIGNGSATAQTATLAIQRSASSYYLAPIVTVPAKAMYTAIAVDDAVYMEPGDLLIFAVGAANSLTLHCSYEVVT